MCQFLHFFYGCAGEDLKSGLVVKRYPPHLFYLTTHVLPPQKLNHPLHPHHTALQEEELPPLGVIQLHDIESRCGCGEKTKTNS